MTRVWAVLACLGLIFSGAGCSSGSNGGQQRVFAVASGFYQGGPGTTSEILDIGLPALLNNSPHSVRLTGITLAGVSKAVRIRNLTVFRNGGGPGVGLLTGDMHACKGAEPVTAVVTQAHQQSAWIVVIAVTFASPGTYWIRHVRITYVTDGHTGWQYQNLNTRMTIQSGGRPPGKFCSSLF